MSFNAVVVIRVGLGPPNCLICCRQNVGEVCAQNVHCASVGVCAQNVHQLVKCNWFEQFLATDKCWQLYVISLIFQAVLIGKLIIIMIVINVRRMRHAWMPQYIEIMPGAGARLGSSSCVLRLWLLSFIHSLIFIFCYLSFHWFLTILFWVLSMLGLERS